MPINLQEIRTAVQTYLDTKVTVWISNPVPVTGSQINPNEEFTFTISAKNAPKSAGGIKLKNVLYHVSVEDPSVAKLIVPPDKMARDSWSISGTVLKPGDQVTRMYLFPASGSDLAYLDVEETDTISLKGKAGSSTKGGATRINFKIYADIDLDHLFPKCENSSVTSRIVTISG